jgi:hypothetical protein
LVNVPVIIYPQKVYLDSLTAVSVGAKTFADLIELWKQTDPGVVIPELTIRVGDAVPSYMNSSYLPATGQLVRLDFVNRGIRNFDLDMVYAALNFSAIALVNSSGGNVAMSSGRDAVACAIPEDGREHYLDFSIHCTCIDPPFVNAPHCPRVVPWRCPDDTAKLLLPTDICDGERDCNDGSDELACLLHLQLDHDIFIDDTFTRCQTTQTNIVVKSGVGKAGKSSLCYMHHLLIRSNRSIEGQIGGETYRIFIADDGCGYALFRLKHDNGSNVFAIRRAGIHGPVKSAELIGCPIWTVPQFQHAYEDFHRFVPRSFSTTPPITTEDGSSSSSRIALFIGISLAFIAVMSFMIWNYHNRQRSSSVHASSTALQQLLLTARAELDELYGQSKTQDKAIITLSK